MWSGVRQCLTDLALIGHQVQLSVQLSPRGSNNYGLDLVGRSPLL